MCIRDRYERKEWQSIQGLLETIDTVSVVLQPSLTESFNYVALESMSRARPCVGSPVIRYLPSDWQPDPNDPQAIADATVAILSDYEEQSARAYRIAEMVADEQNAAFSELVQRLTKRQH